MRILVVSSFLPYPLFSGGSVRLYNLLKELSVHHKVTLVCEKREHQTESDVAEVEKLCEQVVTVVRRKQWSAKNIIKTAFSSVPFLVVGHSSQEMKEAIVTLLNEKSFDLIHVETFYVYQNIPKTYLPTVLVEHNIEYLVYKRYIATVPVYLRPLLTIDIYKIKQAEEKTWRQATKLVAVSEQEKSLMKRTDVVVVPNGVDMKTFPFKKKLASNKKNYRVLFMGDFAWIQNREAVRFILTDIWPQLLLQLQEQQVTASLWIVGKHIPKEFTVFATSDIIFDEHAPDETYKIYQKADILLAPITVGGGSSYKILESMASGVPVVTTTLGISGIGAQADKEALIGKTGEALAKQVRALLLDKLLYEKIRVNARELIEKKYTWKTITQTLTLVYQSALA